MSRRMVYEYGCISVLIIIPIWSYGKLFSVSYAFRRSPNSLVFVVEYMLGLISIEPEIDTPL